MHLRGRDVGEYTSAAVENMEITLPVKEWRRGEGVNRYPTRHFDEMHVFGGLHPVPPPPPSRRRKFTEITYPTPVNVGGNRYPARSFGRNACMGTPNNILVGLK